MRPSNPACYECPKGKNTLHTWRRNADMTATCIECDTTLSVEDAAECFRDYEQLARKSREGKTCALCDATRITSDG